MGIALVLVLLAVAVGLAPFAGIDSRRTGLRSAERRRSWPGAR